jgi:anti-anti-sigma factor
MEKYSILLEKDLLVVQPASDIVSRSYPGFEKRYVSNISEGAKVVFNMEKVNFVDSQGIVFLLRARELADFRGAQFSIYNLKGHISKALKRLQLEKLLNVSQDAEGCFMDIAERNKKAEMCPSYA